MAEDPSAAVGNTSSTTRKRAPAKPCDGGEEPAVDPTTECLTEVDEAAWALGLWEDEAEATTDGAWDEAATVGAGDEATGVAETQSNTTDEVATAVAETPPTKKSVKLKRSITDRIRKLNDEANLPAPLRVGKIGPSLAALDEASALEVLDRMLQDREEDSDPTAWVCWAAKEQLAWNEWEAEEYEKWEENEEHKAADRGGVLEPEVLEYIRKINRSGMLVEPLLVRLISGPLSLLRPRIAIQVLQMLERKASATEVNKPSNYVTRMALNKTSKVMDQVQSLNRGGAGRMDLINPLVPRELVEPLHLIPESVAMSILKKLEARAMDIQDPTSWVKQQCQKHIDANATPLTRQLRSLCDRCKKMGKELYLDVAMEKLSELEEDAALNLIRRLGQQMPKIRSPTSWISAAVAKMVKEAAAAEAGPAGDASDWDEEEDEVAEGKGKKGKGAKGKAANGKTSRGKSDGPSPATSKGKKRKAMQEDKEDDADLADLDISLPESGTAKKQMSAQEEDDAEADLADLGDAALTAGAESGMSGVRDDDDDEAYADGEDE